MRKEVTKAVILVGGWGTRLRPLTYTFPKPLICFCNKPILKYQIEKLVDINVKEIILALNYYSEMIIEEVSKYEDEFGIKIVYSKEDDPLGTAGPLALARDHLQNTNFFVLNSDICCNADLKAMKDAFLRGNGNVATILTYSVHDPTKYGLVSVDGPKVLSFLEKPEKIVGEGPWLINAGIYIFSSTILDYVEPREMSIEKEVFPKLAQENLLEHFQFEGYWMDIGQPKDYLVGQKMELSHQNKDTKFFNAKDNVVIGENVRLGKNCKLKNCTIFNYAIIEDNVVIENSIIGWGCHIQEGCCIKDMSVLGEGVIVEKDMKVHGALPKPNTRITGDN